MPGSDGELSFAKKIRTLQFATGRSRPVRREGRDEAGRTVRRVTERTDSGAITTVTNRSSTRGDHQDVHVQAPLVTGAARPQEVKA
ncbi:hypothetical protein [Streptosporangium sp. NPDC049376]|uniref:hypothetical protein n=1 Tax=Streptosporangium sp. NPDC049376 TaxID=3366192 RepID=UPI0037A1318D